MKPAREPASSRPKRCAFLKKPHESCPFATPCGPSRKTNDRGQISAFPSQLVSFIFGIRLHYARYQPINQSMKTLLVMNVVSMFPIYE